MKAIEFPEVNCRIAEHQPEYITLPSHIGNDGIVTVCWQLTFRERVVMLLRGKFWHQVMTFGKPLQPVKLTVDEPEMLVENVLK